MLTGVHILLTSQRFNRKECVDGGRKVAGDSGGKCPCERLRDHAMMVSSDCG